MLDRWHSAPEVWDDGLDALILEQQAAALRNKPFLDFRAQPYFSPSSASACKRELYEKLRGAKKDVQPKSPHQGRWTRIGTAIGAMIQRDLLFIEKHYERIFGEAPPFIVERTPHGLPMWEDFATRLHVVEHGGQRFALYGKPDGILRYKDGRRVGLEIKSKQTTASKTGSMREAEGKHVAQTVVYTIMYGTDAEPLDDYLVVYVNAAKRDWAMTDEEYAKSPDIAAFHITVTDYDRQTILDDFASVVQAVKDGTPPPLELDKWTFNNYKTACALSLSDEEFAEIQSKVRRVLRSGLPEWKKRGYMDALEFIRNVRERGVA